MHVTLHLVVHLATVLALGSILDDIGGLVDSGISTVGNAAKAVWNGAKAALHFILSVFGHVLDAWVFLVRAAGFLWGVITQFATDAYNAIKHVVTVVIPHVIVWAVRRAEHYAKTAAKFVEKVLTKTIRWVYHELRKAVHAVEHALSKAVHWLTGKLGVVWHWVFHIGAQVAGLVLHPKRLVKWVLADLVEPLFLFVLRHSFALVLLFMKVAVHEAEGLAKAFEDAFAKIL